MVKSETTIKEHLAEIREELEFHVSTQIIGYEGSVKALRSLSAIEAILDRPMKSAEEWMDEFEADDRSYPPLPEQETREEAMIIAVAAMRERVPLRICAIQEDAILHSFPQASGESQAQIADMKQHGAPANASRDAQDGGVDHRA